MVEMVMDTVAAGENGLLAADGRELALRVHTAPYAGQVVRLSAGKCTVGSDPRCTLRLKAPGVQPLECLIVRGATRTVVRQWSSTSRLNGRAFGDATLAAGDRLSLGPIEIEVLDGGRHNRAVATPAEALPAGANPVTACVDTARLDSLERQVADVSARLQLANRQGRSRSRRLIERLRTLRTSEQTLENHHQNNLRQTAALDARRRQLDLEKAAVDNERRQLAARAVDSTRELDDRSRRLETRAADLEAQRQLLEAQQLELEAAAAQVRAERQQWNELQEQFRQRQAESQSALQDERNALAADVATCRAQQAEWEAQRAVQQNELARRLAEIEVKDLDLDRERAEILAERNSLADERESVRAESEQLEAERAKLDGQQEQQAQLHTAEEAALAEREQQIAELEAKLNGEREALAAERLRLETELAARKSEFAQQALDLANQRQAHEAARLAWQQEVTLADERTAMNEAELYEQRQRLAAEQAERAAELATLEASLADREAALDAEQTARHAQHLAEEQRLNAEREHLAERAAQLDHQAVAFQSRQAELEQQHASLLAHDSSTGAAAAELNTQRAAIATAQQELAEQRAAWRVEQAILEESRAKQAAAHEALLAQIEADKQAVADARTALEIEKVRHEAELAEWEVRFEAQTKSLAEQQSLLTQLAEQRSESAAQGTMPDSAELEARQAAFAAQEQAQLQAQRDAEAQLAAERAELALENERLAGLQRQLQADEETLRALRSEWEQQQIAARELAEAAKEAQSASSSDHPASTGDADPSTLSEIQVADLQAVALAAEQAVAQAVARAEEQAQQLATEREAWAAQAAQRESEWADRQEALRRRQQELDEQSSRLEAQQQQLEQQRAAWEAEQESRSLSGPGSSQLENVAGANLGSDVAVPAALLSAFAEQTSTLASERPVTVEPEAPEHPRMDEDDVFSRLRSLSILKPSGDQPDPAPRESAPAAPAAAAPAKPFVPQVKADHEEESIDDYMARLLNRVRGPSASEPTRASMGITPTYNASREPEVVPLPAAAPSTMAASQPEPTLQPLTKMTARSQAPELGADMQAMRELANMSARTAIHTHKHRRSKGKATEKMLIGLTGLLSGSGLMVWSGGDVELPLYGGAAAICAGMVWVLQSLGLAHQAKQTGKQISKSTADITAKNGGEKSSADTAHSAEVASSDEADRETA